jgi:hypothetical protein
MKSNIALALSGFPAPAAPPARRIVRIVRTRRDTGVLECDVFSLLSAKEEECCDRATD